MLPDTITSANAFIGLMGEIWNLAPGDHTYDAWHNANRTVQHYGFCPTGHSHADGYAATVYRHPDRPYEGVLVWNRGTACRATYTTQRSTHK